MSRLGLHRAVNSFVPKLALAFLAGFTALATPSGWNTNLTEELQAAGRQHQPVLVYFTASWCGPCKLMARTTLTDEAVVRALADLPHVAVDIDEQSALAEQHGVRAVPTFLMLSHAGDEIVRTTGYQPAGEFVQWLSNSIATVWTTLARQKVAGEKLAAVSQLVLAGDNESSRKASGILFDLCAETDDAIRKSAVTNLTKLAERSPATLLDGLVHPRLATRIQVANLLRARLGEAFDVDPWADTSAREAAISAWRDRLQSKPGAALEKTP